MACASVKQRIEVPAHKVWALLADFGNTSWMPGGGGEIEVQGSGPGMLRIIRAGEQKIHERLESLDEAKRTLVYTIPEGVPLPVSDYRATVVVSESGAGAAELEWRCSFEPSGADEATAQKLIEGLYATMIGWVRDHLTSAG